MNVYNFPHYESNMPVTVAVFIDRGKLYIRINLFPGHFPWMIATVTNAYGYEMDPLHVMVKSKGFMLPWLISYNIIKPIKQVKYKSTKVDICEVIHHSLWKPGISEAQVRSIESAWSKMIDHANKSKGLPDPNTGIQGAVHIGNSECHGSNSDLPF